MNACMGKDLTGEIAKSQAFLVFKSSYEFTAFAFAFALVLVLLAVIAADDEDEDLPVLPDAFPYNRYIIIHQHFIFIPFIRSGRSERAKLRNKQYISSPVPPCPVLIARPQEAAGRSHFVPPRRTFDTSANPGGGGSLFLQPAPTERKPTKKG
jgi:hypothetical protein